MYLNVKLSHELNYNLKEIIIMQLLKQNRNENMENELAMYSNDDMLARFEKEEIIERVNKKKKADSDFSVMRLSKIGLQILEDVQTPEVTQGDLDMYAYLTNMYLSHEDTERIVGNKKKVRLYCVTFRRLLGLSLHEFYWLAWSFLQEYKWTKKLENIFMDSNKNRYGTLESNLEDSPLFQYYEKNKTDIEALWKKKIK